MAATAADIEEFLAGPLVTWLSTCVKKPETLLVYDTFFDGSPINEVLLQIDPEPSQPIPTTSNLHGLGIVASRIKIFHHIIRNIKAIYEEELGQVVVALPDCVTLGRTPASQNALEQLRLLILLLLGCAVQGPTKEIFITRIKELSLEAQHDIVECIKQVTDNQCVVLTQDWCEQPSERLYSQLKMMSTERDALFQQWVADLGQDIPVPSNNPSNSGQEGVESNHLAVELADWKSRLRKQRLELDEKTEFVTECKEQLVHLSSVVSKLKSENADLLIEARKAAAYRDELDAVRERAARADRLEIEAQRYRERLADAEFYRVRVEELRADNRVLLETREMLEAQVARARARADRVAGLEAELVRGQQAINDIVLERDAAREKIQELLDENLQLQQVTKSALQETNTSHTTADSDNEDTTSGDNSLSEQLTNNAQARALKLELENRKLLSTIDSLREHNLQQHTTTLLELEKDKKRLSLKLEQLQTTSERLTQQNSELESLFQNAIGENGKLQEGLDSHKVLSDRQLAELKEERVKVETLEKSVEVLTKEKQRVQSLCESVKKRADDADREVVVVTAQRDAVQGEAVRCKEVERGRDEAVERNGVLEKENAGVQKEVGRLKEMIEIKERKLDEQTETAIKLEKEITRLNEQYDTASTQLEKLQEFEQKAQELLSQTAVHTETITTLQKDLVAEKISNEKFKSNLEKLGLNLDILDNDINVVLEKMLSNPDLARNITSLLNKDKVSETAAGCDRKCLKCLGDLEHIESSLLSQTEQLVSTMSNEWHEQCEKLCAELATAQQLSESLQTENAKMQVDVATLSAQVNSLSAQQTALQLANSQLVAEKEELAKQHEVQNKQHDTLLLDQVTMRTLHDQLSSQYENLQGDQETLKKSNRDMRGEIRTLKDENDTLKKKTAGLEHEIDTLRNESKSLGNLRNEHSKLKDDFRNLFTANERLKSEYRGLQDEYRSLRAESGKLQLGNTEMQGELNSRSDLVAGLKLENAQLQQRCDMLFEMNHTLDNDRRKLMDHASQLLKQYHSLLTHSIEDTQHYHLEEKIFHDKVNNLCRQKEKLEEKIMEHYRKLDNASAKKKGFGATFVRKVRKAGSDIINKVPSRNRSSWHEDARLSHSQFTIGGVDSNESAGNDSDNSAEDPKLRSNTTTAVVATSTTPNINTTSSLSTSAIDQSSSATPPPPVFKRSTIGSLQGKKPRDEVALRRSHRDLSHRNSIATEPTYSRDSNSALSLGSVGTRRTVYLSEDDPPNSPPVNVNPPAVPPMLVYNRISTVIGETQRIITPSVPTPPTEEPAQEAPITEKKKSENAKENAIWYEYGCV